MSLTYHRFSLLALLLLGVAVCAPTAYGQEFGRIGTYEISGVPYHVFAPEGVATVQVLVVGSGSGIYEVGEDIRLDELYTITAGLDPASARIRVRLYRQEGGERIEIYEAKAKELLRMEQPYPKLRDGDVFVVESKPRFSLRQTLRTVSSVASIVLLVERLSTLL